MKIKKLQQGGMPVQEVPAATPQNDMMAQLEQMAAEIINSLGVDGAAMLAEMIMQILQSAQQPINQAPTGSPVFKRGGKIARRVK